MARVPPRPVSGASRSGSVNEPDLVARLMTLYRGGWFPMYEEETGVLEWVQPNVRSVIPLREPEFRVTRSLRSAVRRAELMITTDAAFGEVMRACARPAKGREQTWINDDIIQWFLLLHRHGHAHSVEAWLPDPSAPGGRVLVGGLYGLAIGAVFAGESMFSRPDLGGTDSSKVCLVHLVHHLRRQDFVLLDAQLDNPHLHQFGAAAMPRAEYLDVVARFGSEPRAWTPFEPEATVRAFSARGQ